MPPQLLRRDPEPLPFPLLERPASIRLALDHGPATAVRELQESLRDIALGFGLQGGLYVHLGHAVGDLGDERTLSPVRLLASSVSDRKLYLDEGGLTHDPIPRRAAGAHTPFVWSAAADEDADDAQRWLAGRLKGRGVHGGLVAPVQDYAAGPAYLSLYSAYNGEAEQIVATHGPQLAYAAAAFHQQAKATLAPLSQSANGPALTSREMGCLRLAALGRTVTETASALQVTPRTVEFHLKNAADKLGASNKVQAVALAVSRRLIEI